MKKIMEKTVLFICFLSYTFICICLSSCAADNPNRVYFKIDSTNRKIVIPVQLNDSIIANLAFDTGGSLNLDSTFCAVHSTILLNNPPVLKKQTGSSWTTQHTPALEHKANLKIKIGNDDLKFDQMTIYNWRDYMHSSSDGMFNIPKDDTTNVWELNFENNYMEIHPAVSFKMPENCFVVPMVRLNVIQLPLKIKSADGDTLTLNRTFFIDTGMSWDIALMYRAGELPFFNKKVDAVWTEYLGTYMRYYTVNATLFDHVSLDSLRIYTFDYPNGINCNYLIGQNFLKRFNVFFDMKNRQVGLQPIKNFQRVVNPTYWRFHYSTHENSKGKYIVDYVADYKGNYYKTAGLKAGDEIISINGKPYKKISYLEKGEFYKQNKLLFDIIRKGRPMKIVVWVDKNEK